MQFDSTLGRRALSGWVPALLSVMVTVVLLLTNGVSAGEVTRFAAYCVLGLVLPGLVLWRLLVPRTGTTLVADAVFGTALALAVELVVYSALAHVDHPGVARLWPVVPLGLAFVPRWRGRVWRHAETQPAWWSWSMGGLVSLAVVILKQAAWVLAPLTPQGLSSPYVDIPYHLSLVAGLSHHVRSDLLFAQGEPLYYHWFAHAHVAAERHATGIEPIVLLSRLDMLIPAAIVLIGSAMLAQRAARSPLAGLVATATLVLGGTALIWPHHSPVFLDALAYLSPTTAFASAILVGCIAITFELVDPDHRPPPTVWVAAVLLVLASSGAKGSALPVLLAGWVSLLLMGLVLRRGVHWPVLWLTMIGAVVFLIAQKVIYGGSAQGTDLGAFGLGDRVAFLVGIQDEPTGGSSGLRATVTTVYVLIKVSCLVAVIGLFTPRVWRDPRAHFLVGTVVAALGAVFLLDNATLNQMYFLLVTPAFIAVITGWGLVELLRRVEPHLALRVCGGFLAAGVVLSAFLLWPLRPSGFAAGGDGVNFAGRGNDVTLSGFVLQFLVVVALLALVGLGTWLLSRRPGREAWRHTAPLACVSLVLGLGLLTGPLHALDSSERVPNPSPASARQIGTGGITAARWLRDHSAPDAVVATNSHCMFPGARQCDHRSFWISGYAERQMLVEGWSYTSRAAEIAAKAHEVPAYMSYWKPDVLAQNDLAIRKPTRKRLDALRRDHDVDWLFVDKRFPADLPALERLADLRFETRDYAVLELR